MPTLVVGMQTLEGTRPRDHGFTDVQKRNAALYRRFSLETGLPLVALIALLI